MILKGEVGRERFIEDVLTTARNANSDVVFIDVAGDGILRPGDSLELERLVMLGTSPAIKCLLLEDREQNIIHAGVDYRMLSRHYVDPLPYCVYGNKFAVIVGDDGFDMKIVIIDSASIARASRKQFYSMWGKATPYRAGTTALASEGRQTRRSS